jgi:SPP1 family predicted phage head-tail adaptor
MPLVSDAQLAQLRFVAYQGLDTEIVIKRPTQAETVYGSVGGYTTVATTTAWIREMSTSRAGIMLGVIATTGTFRLHVRYDTDIRPGDRVEVNGESFEVQDLNELNTIRVFTTAVMRRVE